MIVLLDTHLLLWLAADSPKLSRSARDVISARRTDLAFSAASIWEIAIKSAQRKLGFDLDVRDLRKNLLRVGLAELPMTSAHAIEAAALPPIHRDPFDRMLVGQVRSENATLLTADTVVASYGHPVQFV